MSELRPARPDEVPKFGSIWSWSKEGLLRMAIAVTEKGTLISACVTLHGENVVDSNMMWFDPSGRVTAGIGPSAHWFCHDE